MDINLISGLRHYKAGGSLKGLKLLGPDQSTWGILDPKRYGFFLDVKGTKRPTANVTETNFGYGTSPYGVTERIRGPDPYSVFPIGIQIPISDNPPANAQDYTRFGDELGSNTD